MSKVLVSSQGRDLDSQVDPRFGRAANYIVIDMDTMEFTAIDNSAGRSLGHGAGIQAAETAANSGAEVVLSGFVGPKAYHALSAAGIRIGQGVDGLTVRDAVERYRNGDVKLDGAPSKPGGF
jgi:predicted Fe-Mo cluster-binding NifX family protein